MDEHAIKAGFAELSSLAEIEYHQSLSEVLADQDKQKVTHRIGRLVGVLIKEPFANPADLTLPSRKTAAYRSWLLKDYESFMSLRQKISGNLRY
jgi:hypothetical protein